MKCDHYSHLGILLLRQVINEVSVLIMATKQHRLPDSLSELDGKIEAGSCIYKEGLRGCQLACALLLDADLGILAVSPGQYKVYTDAVRKEYCHMTDEAFRYEFT